MTIFFLVTVRFLAGWKISSFWGYFFFFSRQSPDPSIKRWKTLGLLSQSTQSLRGGHRKTGANLHEISKMAAVSEQWCISTRIFLILVILSTSANVHGWDSIDLELFDLVEEVKDNFYGVLGLKQVSTVVYFGWLWLQTGRILFGQKLSFYLVTIFTGPVHGCVFAIHTGFWLYCLELSTDNTD